MNLFPGGPPAHGRILVVAVLASASMLAGPTASRAESGRLPVGPDAKVWQRTVQRGVAYLKADGQQADGSFSRAMGPSVTALVTTALLQLGRTPADPVVAAGLAYVRRFVRPDGGIYREGSLYRNYETCLAIVCFSRANADGQYSRMIGRAEAFVKGLQWTEDDGVPPSSNRYGGAGYGSHRRPDLSNTSFLVDTLKAVGRGPDDEALRKALTFVSRCQNRYSEHNRTEFAARNQDGGFYYTPAAGGLSQAGKTPDGGLRSYGSMTYAGLKSMIYAGVGPDDPRVKAARTWIQRHYTLQQNPGLQNAGLYYYYHTFAKALDAVGVDRFEAADGQSHDWRRELTDELARRQLANGSWVNDNSRWSEGDANLVTGYALLALSYCRPPASAANHN